MLVNLGWTLASCVFDVPPWSRNVIYLTILSISCFPFRTMQFYNAWKQKTQGFLILSADMEVKHRLKIGWYTQLQVEFKAIFYIPWAQEIQTIKRIRLSKVLEKSVGRVLKTLFKSKSILRYLSKNK